MTGRSEQGQRMDKSYLAWAKRQHLYFVCGLGVALGVCVVGALLAKSTDGRVLALLLSAFLAAIFLPVLGHYRKHPGSPNGSDYPTRP